MKYSEFNTLVMAELDRAFARLDRGGIAELQRQMGVNPTYFRQWRGGANTHVPRLLEALELLDIDAFEFFLRALQPDGLASEVEALVGALEKRERPMPETQSGRRALELVDKDLAREE